MPGAGLEASCEFCEKQNSIAARAVTLVLFLVLFLCDFAFTPRQKTKTSPVAKTWFLVPGAGLEPARGLTLKRF